MRFTHWLNFAWLVVPGLATLPAGPAVPQSPLGDVTVIAVPAKYEGRCPARIRFVGRINVATHPMAFNYQFERSDGAKSELKVIRVPNDGPQFYTVTETWQLGASGQHLQVWQKLRVASGVTRIESSPATVEITCR